MKKKILFLLFFYPYLVTYAQKNLDLRFLIGTRIQTNKGDYVQRGKIKDLTSPIIGLELFSKKYPFSLSYQFDFWFLPQRAKYFNTPYYFDDMILGHIINAYWHKNNYKLGLGYYQKIKEGESAFLFNGLRRLDGLMFSLSVPFDGFDIEYRHSAYIKPIFDIRGVSHQNLAVLYRFKNDRVKKNKKFDFNILTGARFYSNKGVLLLGSERISPIGLAYGLGVEFLYQPKHISLSIEKDWLFSINVGSIERSFKQYRNSSYIATKYHFNLKNNRKLIVGVGAMFIIDYDLKNYSSTSNNIKALNGYSDIKGIGLSTAYELFKNTFIEVRHTIPIKQIVKPERVPNLSLGIIYRYNRLNSSK